MPKEIKRLSAKELIAAREQLKNYIRTGEVAIDAARAATILKCGTFKRGNSERRACLDVLCPHCETKRMITEQITLLNVLDYLKQENGRVGLLYVELLIEQIPGEQLSAVTQKLIEISSKFITRKAYRSLFAGYARRIHFYKDGDDFGIYLSSIGHLRQPIDETVKEAAIIEEMRQSWMTLIDEEGMSYRIYDIQYFEDMKPSLEEQLNRFTVCTVPTRDLLNNKADLQVFIDAIPKNIFTGDNKLKQMIRELNISIPIHEIEDEEGHIKRINLDFYRKYKYMGM